MDKNSINRSFDTSENSLGNDIFDCVLLGEKKLFGCPESAREEEEKEDIKQSSPVTDYLLAETSECVLALKVASCFPLFICEPVLLFHRVNFQQVQGMLNGHLSVLSMQCHDCLLLSSSQPVVY